MLGKYSKSRYNGMMQNLRALFDEAVASGALPKNPCRDPGFKFRTLKVPPKDLNLPTDKDFEELCTELLSMKNGCGKWVVQSVKLLAMTGCRIKHASLLLKSDVDFEQGVLLFRKEIMKGGKKASSKNIPFPLHPQLRELCQELVKEKHGRGDFLMPTRKFYVSLHSACDRLAKKRGVESKDFPHWTPHDFRHLFSTKLLSPENQKHVSITTAAKWLGHRDGGKLMLERYAHVIREHEAEAAKHVTVF